MEHPNCTVALFYVPSSVHDLLPTFIHAQMFSLHDGEELLSYDMDYVRALGGRKVAATAIARDWKSDQMFVGFTNGAVALYDMNNPKPINVFRRTIENFPITGVIDDFYFLGTRAYLLFVQELKLPVYQFGLFDFLELSI